MKKFNVKQLTVSVATALGLAMVGSTVTTTQASDIEIYTVPDKAQKTIVMMLDTSGSMSVYPAGVSACDIDKNDTVALSKLQLSHPRNGYDGWVKSVDGQVVVSNQNDPDAYHARWCQTKDGKIYYDRMSKLKEAVMTLMNSTQLDDSLVVGVGQFTDDTKGMIKIPAKPLTAEHRREIKNYIRSSAMGGSGPTPTATAYAEAAAYLLGTTTLSNPKDYVLRPQGAPVTSVKEQYVQGDDPNLFWKCHPNNNYPTGFDITGACQNIAGASENHTRDSMLQKGYIEVACRSSRYATRTCMHQPNVTTTYTEPAVTVDTSQYSGFSRSVGTAKNGVFYNSPLPVTGRECSGQAIYFLTDGFPNNANNSQGLMRIALGNKAGDFPSLTREFRGTGFLESDNETNLSREGMAPAGELAKRLRDPSKNPQNVSISTALVGFGKDFEEAKQHIRTDLIDAKGKARNYYDCSKITTREIRNACNFGEKSHTSLPGVGGYGEGGFFYAEQADDLITSFLAVANNIEVKFEPVTTGAPTIPLDSLLAGSVSDQAYYGAFTPRPESAQQLWTGDMNKYQVVDGVLKSGNATDGYSNLFRADGSLNSAVTGLWGTGVKSKLALRDQENIKKDTGRIILTNRVVEGGVAKNSTKLQEVTVSSLFEGDLKGDTADRNYWLNALGYNVGESETISKMSDLDIVRDQNGKETKGKPELRQIGASMHSNPILLTQKGRVVTTRDSAGKITLSAPDREDYLLFGSTQGILHVIDDKTGQEKFAFIPHEMMAKQKKAFLSEGSTSGGKNDLFYGIDGAWVAHTQYVPVSDRDNTLTVGDSELKAGDNDTGELPLRGIQWVYGGLRMGGKSYYSLDLSNINTPKLKFHIDPENQAVHTEGKTLTYPQLKHMGQSWSKPTLGYVRWNGQRKLVMFVGGGYDTGYENTTYQQNADSSKEMGVGAGVYMFDAASGELLWWATAHTTTSNNVALTRHNDLRFSVVSRINTLDRDGDGLIDNLYFGDLAGQGFRVDLNNESQKTENNTAAFGHRVTRIMNEHQAGGKSPRFYTMPSLSIHTAPTGNGKRFLVVAFGSGDSSSPLAGVEASVQGVSRTRETAVDGVFVVYDNDVGRTSLYDSSFTAEPLADNGRLKDFDAVVGVPQLTTGENNTQVFNRGWKYIFPENKVSTSYGRYKVLNEPFALTDLLFVNAYNKDESQSSSVCGGGLRGTTYIFQYCLPTGQCLENKHGFASRTNEVAHAKVGYGNVNTAVGNTNNKGEVNSLGNVGGGGSGQKCDPATNPLCYKGNVGPDIKQLRWYESR